MARSHALLQVIPYTKYIRTSHSPECYNCLVEVAVLFLYRYAHTLGTERPQQVNPVQSPPHVLTHNVQGSPWLSLTWPLPTCILSGPSAGFTHST